MNNSVKYMDKDKPKINLRVKDVGILFRSKSKITEKELRQKICQMCLRDFTGRTHQEIPQKEEAVLRLSIVTEDYRRTRWKKSGQRSRNIPDDHVILCLESYQEGVDQ